MAKRKIRFSLKISAQEYLHYYSGVAREVVAVANDGRVIQFPANVLRQFVAQDGIHGEFVIEFDDNNKLVAIQKL